MRKDMHRVIIERPRKLESAARKGRARPLEELPGKQGMRRGMRERGGDKSFSDHLNPLRRYLDKQVGRPWNTVYSEITADRRLDSTIHRHLLTHLRDFVARTPRRRVITFGPKGGPRERRTLLWGQPYYVDERDGILKRTDHLPEEKARRRKLREEKLAHKAAKRRSGAAVGSGRRTSTRS